MAESLRRLCVFALYLAVVIRFVTWDQFKDVFDDLIEFRLLGYLIIIGIGIIVALLHKGINWIFQK